jgi:hypothetical protein
MTDGGAQSINLHAPAEELSADRPTAGRTDRDTGALLGGGTEGNERLTVLTGATLVLVTAAVGVTIVWIGPLLWEHFFVGLMLMGPLMLKLASTGYRFGRYYTRDPPYRRKGPPVLVLRALAPLVVLSTVALMGTGVALLFAGPDTAVPLSLLHKVAFIAWITLVAIHVLGHTPEMLRAIPNAGRTRQAILDLVSDSDAPAIAEKPSGGAGGRTVALLVSLLAGAALATVLIGQYSNWVH